MLTEDLKKRKKIKCPFCNSANSQVWVTKEATAKGVWVKCKICKKEFEIKLP